MNEEQNINQLPKGWKCVKVGEYVISVKGKKPKRVSNTKTKECSIPYVNIKAFEKNIIDEYTDGVGCALCDDGDFLMVWDGSRSGYVGKAIKGALGSTLVKLNFPDMYNNYAFYFLQSKYLDINTRAKGVGIPHVDPNILWNYDLLIPPRLTQQAIVSKIEELFSELDKGIENLRTAQQQLKTYRQSVLKWAFEGKLTKEWRKAKHLITSKDFTASITKKRELNYKRKLDEWTKAKLNSVEEKISKPQRPSNLDPKNDLFEGLVEKETLPVEWEIVPLVYVSDNQPNSIVDGPFGSSINVNEDYIDSGVPVIRMVNIRPFRFVQDQMKFIKESKFQSLRRHNILPNDILIAKVGATIGDCCIYPINQPEAMLSTTGSCRIRLDKNVMNTKFLEYHISFYRNTLKDIASQTAQPFLNMKVLKSFPVVLPTIEEQNNIVEEIESRLSISDKMEESITQSLKQAEALRQSILKKAFEGKLI